jgi:CRISPR-associated protein Cmr4
VRLATQVVVLHDNDFAWFARYGLAVQARNVLDEKKTSKNLWYEETIPADSLFYTLLAERQNGALAAVKRLFDNHPYLQVGGNETVGMGWFAVAFPNEKGGVA